MELRKKVTMSLAVLLATLGTAAAVATTPAIADEGVAPMSTADYTYAFSFSAYGDWKRTAAIPKEDSSATYVHAESNSTGGTFLYVDSYSSSTGYINQTVGGYAYLGTRTGYFSVHQKFMRTDSGRPLFAVWPTATDMLAGSGAPTAGVRIPA